MSFTSLSFLLLVAGAVLVYYLLPQHAQWCVLLAASLVFYCVGGGKTVLYVFYTAAIVYVCGLLLGHYNDLRRAAPKEERKAVTARYKPRRRAVVLVACLLNFGLLYVLKYWNFTADLFLPLADRAGVQLPLSELVLPLGVSFFMFQSVGYVIDVYRDKYAPEHHFGKLLLFVSFFPQMVQGPISRFGDLGPQLLAGRSLDFGNLKYGIQLMLWGYFKKLVIADRAAVLVSSVLDHPWDHSGSILAVGVLFYCIQLYGDFSGGIDITRGVAKLFGIDLAENFRRPLYATSLTDFWRRWHITLGSWMRDYVFYPLSLSKPFGKLGKWARKHLKGTPGKIFATSAATFIVYLIIGIWHGANFRYIAFGLWNGTLITASLLMERRFLAWKSALHINDKSTGWRIFMTVRTALLVFIGRYFTRAPRLTVVFSLLKTTVLHPNFGELPHKILTLGLTAGDLLIVAAGILIVHIVEFFEERGTDVCGWLNARKSSVQVLILLVSLLILAFFGIFRSGYISSEFIYGQF